MNHTYMISLNKIQLKFSKKTKKFKKEKSWLNIYFYWKLVIGILFVTTFLYILFSYRFFLETNKDFILLEDSAKAGSKTVQKDRIDKILEYFSQRKEKSKEIINSPAPIIDPSL